MVICAFAVGSVKLSESRIKPIYGFHGVWVNIVSSGGNSMGWG